jgi:hypothetical protein
MVSARADTVADSHLQSNAVTGKAQFSTKEGVDVVFDLEVTAKSDGYRSGWHEITDAALTLRAPKLLRSRTGSVPEYQDVCIYKMEVHVVNVIESNSYFSGRSYSEDVYKLPVTLIGEDHSSSKPCVYSADETSVSTLKGMNTSRNYYEVTTSIRQRIAVYYRMYLPAEDGAAWLHDNVNGTHDAQVNFCLATDRFGCND